MRKWKQTHWNNFIGQETKFQSHLAKINRRDRTAKVGLEKPWCWQLGNKTRNNQRENDKNCNNKIHCTHIKSYIVIFDFHDLELNPPFSIFIDLFLVFWCGKYTKRISIEIMFVWKQFLFKRRFPDFCLNFRLESTHKIERTIIINCLKISLENSETVLFYFSYWPYQIHHILWSIWYCPCYMAHIKLVLYGLFHSISMTYATRIASQLKLSSFSPSIFPLIISKILQCVNWKSALF